MSEQGCEQLTLFPAGSPVSRSLSPGTEKARLMTVFSGLRCSEWSRNSGRLGCLEKMCLESSIWHSTRCFLTWKISVTPRRRLLYRLAASMPRTSGNGSLFWPTPTTGAPLYGGTGNMNQLKALEKAGKLTAEEVRNLSSGSGGRSNPELIEWLMGYQKAFTELLPTPTASDYKGAPQGRYITGGYRHNLRELLESTPRGITGRMNPEYVEWLMGYPIGWTESNVSGTP